MNAPVHPLVVAPLPTKRGTVSSGLVASAGAVTSLGAVCASSICTIPLALAGIGAGSSMMAGLEWLTAIRTPLLILNAAILAAGWLLYVRRRRATGDCEGRNRSWLTLAALTVGTTLFALSFVWNAYLEYPLMQLMF